MRVLWPGVDLQLAQYFAAERVVRQHAPYGVLVHPFGMFFQQIAQRNCLESPWVGRVAVVLALRRLVTSDADARGVDDDDKITQVHVLGERRQMLTPQSRGDLGRQAAQRLALG